MASVVPPSLLFDLRLPILRCDAPNNRKKNGIPSLTDAWRLAVPSAINDEPQFANVFAGWNPDGLAFRFEVQGHTDAVQGDRKSDAIQIWLDLRPSGQIHRATEYCHSFSFVPADSDSDDKAAVYQAPIAQQKIQRQEPDLKQFRIEAAVNKTGYTLSAWLPGTQLYGFRELEEIGRFGFSCEVRDSQLGTQPFLVGDDFPTTYDPSLWPQFELTNN